mgnify:CR=1 FL=1
MNNKIFHNLSAAVAAGLALPYSKILKTREFSTQNKMNRLFAGKKRAVAELFILQQLLFSFGLFPEDTLPLFVKNDL